MTRTNARVNGATLVLPAHDASPITVDTPAWFAWLEHATTFAFTSPLGRFAARKEQQARGGGYWKAYRTSHGTLHRAYLGKAQDLTLDRLNRAATTLAAASTPADRHPAVRTVDARGSRAAHLLVPPALPEGTLTFLFTDIVGSTTLWEAHPQAMAPALARHDAILQQVIATTGGAVFKTVGDAVYAVFTTAPDALAAALAAQHALHHEPWGVTGPLRVRMAIHTGAADMRDGDYFGGPLNRVARMLAAGHGGQILLSHATAELVQDRVPAGASLVDLGAHQLKDLSRSEQIFQLVHGDLLADFPPLTTLAARPEDAAILPTNLLATKLFVPPARANLVVRPRLIERLSEGLQRKLTLISAPAGFGKTTLLSAWVALCDRQVAWLSLDEGDSDSTHFLTYLVAALQTIAPTIGAGLPAVLQAPQPPPTEAILTALFNDITTVPDHFVLVLDDYHVLDAKPIDTALTFLLEHLPSQMHLVIATREDPDLPLARLRVRDQLTELRAADLRFTPAEAAAFLSQVMGLDLSAEDVAALESRTEGWIAGLQLAALSMRGREDIPGFIRAFAGDNRYIVDYLVEEVLQRQPEGVRSFLLQTAILDHLSGPLCDAVSGQEGGNALLQALERGNFFVVPLDDTRHWYRYHHLFADVLSTQLRAEQPDLVATLHRRASEWYEHNGSAADAIRHTLAAEAFERAADLVERAVPAMLRSRQEGALLGWLRALPDELLHRRPVLGVAYAHVLLASGEFEGVEDRMLSAERWLDTTADRRARPDASAAEMVVVDEEAFRRLPGQIAIARAGLALARGDVSGTVTYARRALDLAPSDDHLTRGGAAGFLGLASWTSGDLEAAHRTYADGMASLQKAGNIADAINGAITLAAIRMAQGRLREAMRTYERGLQLANSQGAPVVRGAADMHVGMSELECERDDLHAATQHLLSSKELGEHTGFPQNRYRWRVAMARIREAEGDLDGALALLDEAERLYMSDFSPNVRPIAALVTRVWVAQGRLGEALGWAREQGLSAHDDLSYEREYAHITLARVLLAQSQSDRADRSMREAVGLLERLLQAAEAGERTRSVIEILVLLSLAHQAHGDIPAALVPLSRALTLAEREGYVRTFVDEGRPMAVLLHAAAKHGITPSYVRQLRAAFPRTEGRGLRTEFPEATHSVLSPQSSALVEPLSARERDVLRLLRTDLSGPDIARELMVSLHTLRTHTNNIYIKLGVNNRRAAVRRAEELDLF